MFRICRTNLIITFFIAAFFIQSCGSMIYPERIGTLPRHPIVDTTVVGLDALGLILFIVPGVVALIVGPPAAEAWTSSAL